MIRVALSGLVGRRLRTLLTACAVVLGVALVSGTMVLTDTVDRAFDRVFASAYEETDAVVTAGEVVDWSYSGKATVSPALLERVRELPEVEAATGTILDMSGDTNQVKVLTGAGEVIQGSNPTFGLGVDPGDERFNPFDLTDGRWAAGPGEVVLDEGTATDYGFVVGDDVAIAGATSVERYELVGTLSFGELSSLGGATIALFDVPTAQEALGKQGFDAIPVAARDGIADGELVAALERGLPDRVDVVTGDEQAQDDAQAVDEFVSVIRWFLLAFGGVALLVGAFVIFNTLSITVAQRTRELATLRTLGASRRQVLRSVILEGAVLGLVASVVGLALGVGLAKGLAWLFASLDLDLPQAGTVFEARTAVVAVVAGLAVTVAASLVPAVRATRVPPIAAVREGAVQPRRSERRSLVVGGGVLALSGAALAFALGADVPTSTAVLAIAFGSLGLLAGLVLLAPRLVAPLASFVGWPAERVGGLSGRLARENAIRNPGRTAATAAALMIGLALVTFVAVLGRGLLASDEQALRDQLAANVVVGSENGWDTVPVAAGAAVAAAPGVTASSSVRADRAVALGGDVDVSGVDPGTIGDVYRFGWAAGSAGALAGLGRDGALVRDDFAELEGVKVGDSLALTTPAGERLAVRVRGIYDAPRLDPLLGQVVVSHAAFDAAFERPADLYTLVQAGSVEAVERAVSPWPNAKARTGAAFIEDRSAEVRSILNVVYVLLALSVVVSLFGMVNTLVLAVFERTRELGMLRAVGMTRRQARRMIRHESVIIALIGAALGLPLGAGLAAVVTAALSDYGLAFSLPIGALVAFAGVAIAAGVVAAVAPARRAARLNVLRALQFE